MQSIVKGACEEEKQAREAKIAEVQREQQEKQRAAAAAVAVAEKAKKKKEEAAAAAAAVAAAAEALTSVKAIAPKIDKTPAEQRVSCTSSLSAGSSQPIRVCEGYTVPLTLAGPPCALTAMASSFWLFTMLTTLDLRARVILSACPPRSYVVVPFGDGAFRSVRIAFDQHMPRRRYFLCSVL